MFKYHIWFAEKKNSGIKLDSTKNRIIPIYELKKKKKILNVTNEKRKNYQDEIQKSQQIFFVSTVPVHCIFFSDYSTSALTK
jgi:hypothetical protein